MIWPFTRKAPAIELPPEPDIRFVPRFGRPDIGAPVISARSAPHPDWLRKQAQNPPLKFAMCPGMWDYLQAGYIIPAWCDIHIKANRSGVSVRMEGVNAYPECNVQPMSLDVVDGIAPMRDSVKPHVLKLTSPWSVFVKEGISAYLMPALFHSPFLDKLHVYPGIVDYDEFHTANVMFSVLEECEFTIWAGTPLLQFLPIMRHHFTAECGAATIREEAEARYKFTSRKPGYYRRTFHKKKQYDMKIRVEQ